MSPELIFTIANNGILIFWLLLIVAPRWRGTEFAVHSIAVPLILGLAYLWLFTRVWFGGEGARARITRRCPASWRRSTRRPAR